MRKRALIITGVVLGLLIVAGLLWTPGYNRAGVHPALLAIEEPLRHADARYILNGGTVVVGFVDARGQRFEFFLPPEFTGSEKTYPELVVGRWLGSRPDAVKHPCSEDSRKYVAMLLDKYMAPDSEKGLCVRELRNPLLERLGKWWFKIRN